MKEKLPLKIFTIGVYGYTEDAFFEALVSHEIDLFIDIRARRGMRGSKYKFANSKYLQSKLKKEGICYAHLADLAPTKEIRAEQHKVDERENTKKRDRLALSKEFIKTYRRDILNVHKRKKENMFYAENVLARAKQQSQYPPEKPLQRIVLFCVERHPQACHRTLVAEELRKQLGATIEHILSD